MITLICSLNDWFCVLYKALGLMGIYVVGRLWSAGCCFLLLFSVVWVWGVGCGGEAFEKVSSLVFGLGGGLNEKGWREERGERQFYRRPN